MFIGLRKIDLVIQYVLGLWIIISILFGGFYTLSPGFLSLHILQIISGLINTWSFYANGFKKVLSYYWSATIICFLTLVPGDGYLLFTYSFSMVLIVLYWIAYSSLIRKLETREMLNGLVR